MANLNLRGVDDSLAEHLKTEAVWAGMGFHEYCVAILERREDYRISVLREEKEKRLGKIISPIFRPGSEETDRHGNVVPRKKIADISVGGGATEGGGDPCLPRGGKAQDGPRIDNPMDMPGSHVVIPAEDGADYFVAPRSKNYCECEPQPREWFMTNPPTCGICGGYKNDSAPEAPWSRWNKILDSGKEIDAETLIEIKKAAEVDFNLARKAYQNGIKLDREILVRWGLAENYKPQTDDLDPLAPRPNLDFSNGMRGRVWNFNFEEERDGAKGSGEAGQDSRSVGGDYKADAEGDDVAQGGTVATGKPGVNMQALRDICAGKPIVLPAHVVEEFGRNNPDPHEVDLCGFKSYNETDGEWYVCTKEKHGPKIKHGEWLKV